jgi:hypothetical protein
MAHVGNEWQLVDGLLIGRHWGAWLWGQWHEWAAVRRGSERVLHQDGFARINCRY